MGVRNHRKRAPRSVSFSVITVSDTRTEDDDFSGKTIVQIMKRAGHRFVRKSIVRDDIAEIQRVLRELIEDSRTQAIVINGGTGVARRDVTIEAIAHFEEKSLPGFGELFRSLSFREIGSGAMMSRAAAFVSEGKVIFCIPGSQDASKLATEQLIAPEISHIVWEANR